MVTSVLRPERSRPSVEPAVGHLRRAFFAFRSNRSRRGRISMGRRPDAKFPSRASEVTKLFTPVDNPVCNYALRLS